MHLFCDKLRNKKIPKTLQKTIDKPNDKCYYLSINENDYRLNKLYSIAISHLGKAWCEGLSSNVSADIAAQVFNLLFSKHFLHLAELADKSRKYMRYSKQREAVYKVLCGTKTHPNVAWIHSQTQNVIPGIGLATVYRNLEELTSQGRIRKISARNNPERYDADVSPHSHFVCAVCNRITDLPSDAVEVSCKCQNVQCVDVMIYGICDDCKNNNN